MTGASRRSALGRIKSSTSGTDESGDSIRYSLSTRGGKGKELISIGAFKTNLKILVGLMILGITVIYFVINRIVVRHCLFNESQMPRVITPFPSPKLMDLSMFHGEHKESFYWGTYRPHVYFGVCARTLQSLVAGLMWLGVKDEMILVENDMILETSFVKSKGDASFGYGGDWSVRIDVRNKG